MAYRKKYGCRLHLPVSNGLYIKNFPYSDFIPLADSIVWIIDGNIDDFPIVDGQIITRNHGIRIHRQPGSVGF